MLSEEEIADWIAERAKRDPGIAKVIENAHLFDELRQNPAWQKLYQLAKQREEKIRTAIANRIWRGATVSPEEIAYQRGFYQGCIWVLSHPENAEKSLEKAARMAWLLSQDEIEQAKEEADA